MAHLTVDGGESRCEPAAARGRSSWLPSRLARGRASFTRYGLASVTSNTSLVGIDTRRVLPVTCRERGLDTATLPHTFGQTLARTMRARGAAHSSPHPA